MTDIMTHIYGTPGLPINFNLSTSLQLYSMPFWPWPHLPLLCHLTRALPLFFSFSSTFTLCLIALDRHHLIVGDGQVGIKSMDFITDGQVFFWFGDFCNKYDTDSIFYHKTIFQDLSRQNCCQNLSGSPSHGGRRNVGCMVAAIVGAWVFAAISASPVMVHTNLKVGCEVCGVD